MVYVLASAAWLSLPAFAQTQFSDEQGMPQFVPQGPGAPPSQTRPATQAADEPWGNYVAPKTQDTRPLQATPVIPPTWGWIPRDMSRFKPEPAEQSTRPMPLYPGLTAEQDAAWFGTAAGGKKKEPIPGDMTIDMSKQGPVKPGLSPPWAKQKIQDMRYFQDNKEYFGTGDPYGFFN
jgi:hypothetical protein